MKHTVVSGAILALLLSLTATAVQAAEESDATAPPIPEVMQAAVSAAEQTGRLLQRLDRAAWIATDVFQEDRAARKLRKSVRGWITAPTDAGTRVSFFGDGAPARPLYIVDVDASGRTTAQVTEAEAVFDDAEQALVRARASALAQSFLQCSRTYNTVAFAQDGGIHVYLMPGTKKQGVYPAGGHHRFTFDASGTELQSSRGFTRACIDLAPGGAPKNHRLAFMTVSHLLDPQPTEIHVFISLNAPVPLMVLTASRTDPTKPMVWALEQGRISVMSDPDRAE